VVESIQYVIYQVSQAKETRRSDDVFPDKKGKRRNAADSFERVKKKPAGKAGGLRAGSETRLFTACLAFIVESEM
jgi:hypothetical protein